MFKSIREKEFSEIICFVMAKFVWKENTKWNNFCPKLLFLVLLQSHPPHAMQSPPCNRSSTFQRLDAVAAIRILFLEIRDSCFKHYTAVARKLWNLNVYANSVCISPWQKLCIVNGCLYILWQIMKEKVNLNTWKSRPFG